MIVTCQRCATQFQLDDSRVKPPGIRVRCSRCKHAFFIRPAGQSERDLQDEQVQRLVRAALEDAPAGAPDVTQDLPPVSEALEAAGNSIPARPEPAALRADDSFGEADWQFNDDPSAEPARGDPPGDPGEPDELAAAREAVDDLLGSSGCADQLDPGESVEPAVAGPSPDATGASDARPGPEDELDITGSDLGVPEDELDGPEDELDGPEDELSISGDELDGPEDELSISGDELEGAEDELERPEDWDFFPDEAAPAGARLGAEAFSPLESGEVEDEGAGDGGEGDLAEATHRARSVEPAIVGIEPEAPRSQIWLGRAAAGSGWISVAALVLAVLYGGLAPAPSLPRWAGGEREAAGMAVEPLEARWIQNAVAGPLYVVSGTVRSADSGLPISALGDLPALSLVGPAGVALARAPVLLGTPLPERVLREGDPRELVPFHPQARQLKWPPLAPGETRSFQAVFSELPAQAAGFRLEAVPDPFSEPLPGAGLQGAGAEEAPEGALSGGDLGQAGPGEASAKP